MSYCCEERFEFTCLCDKGYSVVRSEVRFNLPFRCECGRKLVVDSAILYAQFLTKQPEPKAKVVAIA